MTKRYLFYFVILIIGSVASSQTGQLSISRIDLMPDLPAPLQIKEWDSVARNYDSFIFDLEKEGQYLPLMRFGTTGQFNYEDNTPVFIDSYVGTDDHLNQSEAINLIPAIVGASLTGIDKSDQNGVNWVAGVKEFFNLKNGQNVYLNDYSTTSGNDWWYDIMPNVYFYQLRSIYPNATPEFSSQFITVADRWLYCVNQLGGSVTPWSVPEMNYRAFNLATGNPLTTGVPEPESAGSIAWLLYNAYIETGIRKYFEGAQLSMDFLTDLETNPSYELQLSYGTLTAARMNAIESTNYPIQKLLDWCFNRGDLRGWGAIVGNWGGYDVSGLIGEANDNGDDYAFVMNGFQQVAALAPLPKYDKRYARAIAKWILNVTNASRLFYRDALPQALQDSYEWSSANDPMACIPHESMKELWQAKSPFATGDAVNGGWAATNLSLYSGSGVGYLAAVVNKTNVPEILQIDMNKTDFYGDDSLAAFLYYNPAQTPKQVTIHLPSGMFDVYEAITESVLFTEVSDSVLISLPAGEVRLIRLYSSGIVPEIKSDRIYAGSNVLDYHYQYSYSEALRIKALSVTMNPVLTNYVFTAYCEPGNTGPDDTVQFEWSLNNDLVEDQTGAQAQFTAPGTPTTLVLKCRISANGQTCEDTMNLRVVEHIPTPPVVNGIQTASKYTVTDGENTFTVLSEPKEGEIFTYEWSASSGILNGVTGSVVTWNAPASPGVSTITVKVTNQDTLSTTVIANILVKDTGLSFQTPVIWYPFDTDNNNAVSDRFHATVSGATKTEDARGISSRAYRFTSGQNIIYTANHDDLNFTIAVSLSCWVKCEQLGSERFIISHGSWQQRYKLSITPEGYFRWTVKTGTGTSDLDASSPVTLNQYYHVCAIYTGYSMELYINGELDTFGAFSGNLLTSVKPLTIGRMDDVETQYALLGSIDEVKIWNTEIPVLQVETLMDQWVGIDEMGDSENRILVYPNPAGKIIHINLPDEIQAEHIALFTADGRVISEYGVKMQSSVLSIEISGNIKGLCLLGIITTDGRMILKKITIMQIN